VAESYKNILDFKHQNDILWKKDSIDQIKVVILKGKKLCLTQSK
jgi:hypothetical protein